MSEKVLTQKSLYDFFKQYKRPTKEELNEQTFKFAIGLWNTLNEERNAEQGND